MIKTKKEKFGGTIGVHNEFTIKVEEYETEACENIKETKEYKAYNVVVNQALSRLTYACVINYSGGSFGDYVGCKIPMRVNTGGGDDGWSNPGMSFGGWIAYGDDNTTPTITDTTLGNEIGRKQAADASDSGIDFASLYSYHTQYIVITPSEEIGEVFKEVGLAGSTSGYLATHALIVDSEGDPLSITKTSTMQITIYAKVYMVLSTPSYANTEWVAGNNNGFLYAVQNNQRWQYYRSGTNYYSTTEVNIGAGSDGTALDAENDAYVNSLIEAKNFIPTRSGAVLTLSTRFETDEGNGKIKEIGINKRFESGSYYSLIRSVMPVTGVFTGSTFTDVELGTGDGVETEFTLGEIDEESQAWVWNEINEANPTVKVDGVTQTAGTDFTYNDSTGIITFESGSIPPLGDAVTASWSVPYIAKNNDYVLDVEFELTFANGSVPT